MNGQTLIHNEQAQPAEILAILGDWARIESPLEDALTFETTVEKWRDQSELVDCQDLGAALNTEFGTNFTQDEWSGVMLPEKMKTLREVCELIASRAQLPKLNALRALGGNCKTGAAFLGLRHEMLKTGVEVQGVRPSTQIDSTLRLHLQKIVTCVTKLAPGALPQIEHEENAGVRLAGGFFFVGLLSGVLGLLSGLSAFGFVGIGLLLMSVPLAIIASQFPPARVEMAGVRTFADLSRLIAASSSQKFN